MIKNLDETKKTTLHQALFYANVAELKNICKKLNIQPHGEKIDLIENVYQFITTGKTTKPPIIPNISKAQPKTLYPLHPETLILYGAFKNDLTTRNFFKQLIGSHFHYTAFGIDWIKAHWLAGTPQTYQQFAIYWQQEFEHRQTEKARMKPEWAYLNFLDRYQKKQPHALKSEGILAWKKYREEQVKIIENILEFKINKIA